MQMNVGFHHFHLRKFHKDLETKTKIQSSLVQIIDNLVYVGGITGIVFTIPQLTKIWIDQQVQGLSLVTWLGFWIATLFWLIYGVVHKARPIIFINLIYGIINTLIVIGILIFE